MLKKRYLAPLAVAAVIAAVTGCSASPKTTTSSGSESTAAKQTPQEAGTEAASEEQAFQGEKVLVWTNNRHDAEYMEEIVKSFNEENQGQIEMEYVITTENYINMITMAISSDQAPDIFCVGAATAGFDLNSFVASGIIQPLNPLLSDEFKGVYDLGKLSYPGINALGEDIYFVPTCQRSGNRLLYNKEMFEAAGITKDPETLEEVVEAAKKMTEAGSNMESVCRD